MASKEKTPMMKQYLDVKSKHPDSILFFRMGDFYEMFYEDAKKASRILDIALTSRNKNAADPVPMCGIPYHAADNYIARIIKEGLKVAICEQVEDPKLASGVVRREVIRIVTPGTVIDSSLLDSKRNNYLGAVYPFKNAYGLAVLDISTGEFKITEFAGTNAFEALSNEIDTLDLEEILFPGNTAEKDSGLNSIKALNNKIYNSYEEWVFEYDIAYSALKNQFHTISLDGFGCEGLKLAIPAAGAIIHYINETQKSVLEHINRLSYYDKKNYLGLDSSTIQSLDLTHEKGNIKKDSLLSLFDKTITPMGARKLKGWILKPLIDLEQITLRQKVVEEFVKNIFLRSDIRDLLKEIHDLERIIGRISFSLFGARDMIALKKSALILPKLWRKLEETSSHLIQKILMDWDNLLDLIDLIDKAVVENPPAVMKDGGVIKDGFNKELDELRSILRDGKSWISRLEEQEKKKTGITTLKVRYNKIYGYYIEVTKKNLDAVPENYIRKQSLVNCERFVSQELKKYEEKIMGAEEKIIALENKILQILREKVAKEGKRVQKMAAKIAEIDVLLTFSEVSSKYNYSKPEMNNGFELVITDGRHPIMERMDLETRFIPNDTNMDCDQNRIMIITGPNMAGKSTYLRQVALIVLMAQMGCFVPVKEAKIGIVDKIFSRVGAQDNILKGQSTFMVEMNETANILNNATNRSLIILDEIGRGTSTFDGISIAWSVVEYLHDKSKAGAKTLFATHYHELTELSMILDGVKNYNVLVREWNDKIIFLRKITEGGSDKSYGIQVARLAGLPDEVLSRAKEVLSNLEKKEFNEVGIPTLGQKQESPDNEEKQPDQLQLFREKQNDLLLQELEKIDINSTSPIKALNMLNELKKKIKQEE
ncbi:MAG: DNA mismatch repair protein MutS [Nitrospinota bacterium]|jgi:DNA mismatch repair protein MutS|nr:DNA mismatch repair protein MutS [Nitrospinota bacterium]MDP7581515.1 DNA mismatch repair protein MutS [Nitrospinota bacterium]HJN02847.1 DNA mismatch repair protein MutS [Nitrospinota bacterium]